VDILEDYKAVSNRATSTETRVLQWKKLFATSSTKKKMQRTTPNMRQTIQKCEYICGTVTERSASKTIVKTWEPLHHIKGANEMRSQLKSM